MHQQRDTTIKNAPNQSVELPRGYRVRVALGRLRARFSPLRGQMARLGGWLEDEVFPPVGAAGDEALFLDLRPDGEIRVNRPYMQESPALGGLYELVAFLDRLVIHRLRTDIRLESNQIEDVLMLLYAYRRELAAPGTGNSSRAVGEKLRSDGGLHFNCMQVSLRGDLLIVQYSYCVTGLSLAVKWFERRHRRFTDHRALFHAAPRYGLLGVVLTMTVLLGFFLTGSLGFLLAATLTEAVILFTVVYVFMRGMGSMEYDNEEHAYRISLAHTTLKRYTDRIRQNLIQAQEFQRKLLPDPQQMPLVDKLEWVSNFAPETEIGGDYFDAAPLGNDQAAIVFADVSGHGMAAALITVIVKMAFKSWCEAGWSVSDFVQRVNRDLYRFTPDVSFVVLVAGVYDDEQKCLTFVNCGHSPEPFYTPADSAQPVTSMTQLGSMLLGVREDIEVKESTQPLIPGDTVLLCTDGLTEAMNLRGKLYGKDRVIQHLEANRFAPLENLVGSLAQDVSMFSGDVEQSDDRMVLAFRVRCPQGLWNLDEGRIERDTEGSDE